MAKAKHDWTKIHEDYKVQVLENNVSLKDFADSHNVPYNYMRKTASKWQQDREIANIDYMQVVEQETRCFDTLSSTDRNLCHIDLYDRLIQKCYNILDNEEKHLQNTIGAYKINNVERLANIIEKCQKGQRLALGLDNQAKSNNGLINELTDAINKAKQDSDVDGD